MGKPFEGHIDAVYCVAFSPDGKHMVSGSADSIICLWNTETGSQVGNLTGHQKVIHVHCVLPRWKIGHICLWIAQDPAHGGKSSLMQIWCHPQGHHHHVVSCGLTNWSNNLVYVHPCGVLCQHACFILISVPLYIVPCVGPHTSSHPFPLTSAHYCLLFTLLAIPCTSPHSPCLIKWNPPSTVSLHITQIRIQWITYWLRSKSQVSEILDSVSLVFHSSGRSSDSLGSYHHSQ